MKQALPLVLGSALAGVLGGTIASILLAPRGAPIPETVLPPQAFTGERATLQIEELRREIGEVLARLTELEARTDELAAGMQAREPALDPVGAFENPSERAGPDGADAASAPAFTSQIEQALTDIRTAEEAERQERRQEAMEMALNSRVDLLAEDLGLVSWQKKELRAALETAQKKREELWTSLRESPDRWMMRDSFREEMRAIGDETRKALSQFLTENQLQQLQDETAPWFRSMDSQDGEDQFRDRERHEPRRGG